MIRVIRVIEYEYPSMKEYLLDRQRWTNSSPPGNPNKMISTHFISNSFKETENNG
jgi:hypothetical protein